MKFRFLIAFLTLLIDELPVVAQYNGGYVSVKPVSCQNYEMEISINIITDDGPVPLCCGSEINYGDGTIEHFVNHQDAEFQHFVPDKVLMTTKKEHIYSGPGQYTVSFFNGNRYRGFNNFYNSVFTPIYLETTFTIDPSLGCIQTPTIENLFFPEVVDGNDYYYDLVANPDSRDSLTFAFGIPKKSQELPVINYTYPISFDDMERKPVSQMGLDTYNGLLQWQTVDSIGNYLANVRMKQYREIDNEIYTLSETSLDLPVGIQSSNRLTPAIMGMQDTAIVAGAQFSLPVSISGGDQDTLKILQFGDLLRLPSHAATTNLNASAYYPAFKNLTLDWNTNATMVRSRPYKFVVTAIEKNTKLTNSRSAYIWLLSQQSHPDAPTQLSGLPEGISHINLQWKDNSNDEAGFILERANDFRPGFIKIATLPKNTTTYADNGIVPLMHYQYRIKAVGTTMSDYSNIAEVHTPITTGMEKTLLTQKITIFPNPNDGAFTLSLANVIHTPAHFKLLDLSGKTIFEKEITKSNNKVNLALPGYVGKGIYLVMISESDRKAFIKKIVIQ